MIELIKRLFRPDEDDITEQLEKIRKSVDRAGDKIEKSLMTINGEEDRRYLCLTKDRDTCNGPNAA